MNMKPTTKQAFQAATAIFIAELISWYFQLERGYWMAITAMALTMQTWGESLMRSFERVSMTIFGGAVGTLFYFTIPRDPIILISCLFIFVFFTVYMRQIMYLASVFFLTCFVVFLFALIGEWTVFILFDRILETIFGAAIALFVGRCFFSQTTDVPDLFINFFEKINASLRMIFEEKQTIEKPCSTQYLAFESQKIRKKALSIRYELLFHRMSPRDFNTLLTKTMLSTQYVINLIDAYQWFSSAFNAQEREEVITAFKTTCYNIEALMKQLKEGKHFAMLPVTRVSDRLSQLIIDDPGRFSSLDNEALGFFSLMYFFTQLNTCLTDMNSALGKAAI